MKTNSKVVSIATSYPTVEGTPSDDEKGDVYTVDPGKTRTQVGWPDNWLKLTPRWRATLAAQLVKRVLGAVIGNDQKTFEEFQKITGWGKGEST